MSEMNTIAEQTELIEAINEIKESYKKSTNVVGWYAHSTEVRGPFFRWLNVSEVAPEYKKNVASREEDARYASAAMNYAPKLVYEIVKLKEEIAELQHKLQIRDESYYFLDNINTDLNYKIADLKHDHKIMLEALKITEAVLISEFGYSRYLTNFGELNNAISQLKHKGD